mgnify:FL=1
MENAINWIDKYYISKYRIVLTNEQLQIPGLRTFGNHIMTSAVAPLPNHYHEDCFEFTFILKGAISFSVEGTDYKISGNDVFMTKPNEIHSTDLTPLSAGEIIWFQLDTKDPHNFLFLSDEAANDLISRLKRINCHVIKIGHNTLHDNIKTAWKFSTELERRFLTANYITLTLYNLIEYANQVQFKLTPDIGKAIDYILNHINLELSLDEIAKISFLSTSQFKQKFKMQMGITPRHFINLLKIDLSKEMLKEGRSVTEVAMALGFSSSSYFSVVFRRYNACSPSEYLKHKQHIVPEYFKK